eukprot:SAG25_NODE_12910_length_274_cov_0.205714_1_plen_55_part_01
MVGSPELPVGEFRYFGIGLGGLGILTGTGGGYGRNSSEFIRYHLFRNLWTAFKRE